MAPGLTSRGSSDTVRAISGPLTSWDQHTGRPILVFAAPRLLGLDVRVDRIRDRLVGALGLVLVDHRRAFAVVSHAGNEVPEPRGVTARPGAYGGPALTNASILWHGYEHSRVLCD